jgi:adenylylsulfate kinase-like enzyme
MKHPHNQFCIYVTGLPGAGKTTIGRYVSGLLAIPILDKDDYLETLFESRGLGNSDWRHSLSREADSLFQNGAKSLNKVVLVSHWRPKNELVTYGTASDWLGDTFSKVFEVYCDCSIKVATNRFTNRVRHKGHVDGSKTSIEVEAWLSDYAVHLPIGIGERITVNSESENWKDEIKNALQRGL